MKLKEYNKVRTQSPAIEAVQDSLVRYFRQLQANPMLDGRLIDVEITGGSNTTKTHNLERTPQGWIVCDLDTDTTVFRVSWTDTDITLTANNDCKLKVWVF